MDNDRLDINYVIDFDQIIEILLDLIVTFEIGDDFINLDLVNYSNQKFIKLVEIDHSNFVEVN